MPFPRLNFTAPALCLLLLGAVYTERRTRPGPADVEPYHHRAKQAVDAVRYTIGLWTGSDVPIPAAAQQLLRPNALLSRQYFDNTPRLPGSPYAQLPAPVSLLIVQCRDPRDMQGHYPPNCYPAHGFKPQSAEPRDFTLPAAGSNPPVTLHCTEYRFATDLPGQRNTTVVLNTLLIPGTGSTPDMTGVYRAAENYQRRLYGAAQLQIVLPDTIPPERRTEIYRLFLAACAPVVRDVLDVRVPSPSSPQPSQQSFPE